MRGRRTTRRTNGSTSSSSTSTSAAPEHGSREHEMGVIYLLRHGQASLFGRDYDVLSDTGGEQSRLVGAALSARGVRPDLVVRGSLRRHRQTTEAVQAAAGWEDLEVMVDPRWDEIDHVDIIKAHEPRYTSHAAMVDHL